MKKILQSSLFALVLTSTQLFGQFWPASNPDFVFPPPTTAGATQTHHMSSYDYTPNLPLPNGNFNVYSWSGNDPAAFNNAGIAYAYYDPSNSSIIDQNFRQLHVKELEVGLLEFSGNMYVVASYESFGGGVYINIYRYNFMVGLTPFMMNVLIDPTGSKPRISSYKTGYIAITFESANGIGVSTYSAGMPAPTTTYIAGTTGCSIPDIAFTNFSNMDVFVSYWDPGVNAINVVHEDFFTLLASPGTIPFLFDDMNLLGTAPNYIDLDCMGDMSVIGLNLWAYTYDQVNDLYVRMINPSMFFVDVILTDPVVNMAFRPRKASIAMDYTTSTIDIAWGQETLFNASNNTIGKQIDIWGNLVVPLNNYVEVPSTPLTSPHFYSLVALSKNKFSTNEVFCAFSLDSGNPIVDINYKFKSIFVPTYLMEQVINDKVKVYPNPCTAQIVIDISDANADEVLNITIMDISGRLVYNGYGNLDVINAGVNQQLSAWAPGSYLLQVNRTSGLPMQTIKFVKQ
jgi:hypothetical protein